MFLDIKPFQETLGAGVCAPATLKMLLTFFNLDGQDLSDLELAQKMGTDKILGTSNSQFIQAMKDFGLSPKEKYNANFEDIYVSLKRGNPVVVDWFSPGRKDASDGSMPDGHYSLVCGLDQENIYLQDPETGGMRTIPRQEFMRVWFDFDSPNTDYILEVNDIFLRYMIEVSVAK